MSVAPLWRWQDLCAACRLPVVDGPDVAGISIDTRSLAGHDLFVALEAGRDGHEFLPAAEAAGAAGALVRRGTRSNLPMLEVDDTLTGLEQIGAAARARMSGAVAAITGSAGKTTARQWLQQILSAQAKTHASEGSYNNHWGVPLSLARMPADSEYGIFEVGTNHEGEIAPLSRQVSPMVSVLLNVLPAHIGNFPSLDALRREKLSIEAGLRERGTLIVPESLDLSGALTRNVLTYGDTRKANVFGKAHYEGGGANITVRIGGRSWDFRLNLPGEHRVQTATAVFATLFALDADLDAALPEFANLSVPRGRGNPMRIGPYTVIDDSYNANPVSMRYAIDALAAEAETRIAILGEMLELGDDAPAMHAEVEPACRALDGVITVGRGFEGWGESLGDRHWMHVDSALELDIDTLLDRIDAARNGTNCSMLVKGANRVFWVHNFVSRLAETLERRRTGNKS